MKGLVLKDIYCARTLLILGMLLMAFPNLMLLLFGGGMAVGLDNDFIGAIPYAMLGYSNIIWLSTFALNSFADDESTGWNKLQGTMPVSRGEIVRAKFMFALLTVGALTAVTLLSSVFGIVIFEITVEPMLTIPLCLALFEICVLFATIAINFRYGTKYSKIAYYAFVTLGTAAMIAMLFAAVNNSNMSLMLRLVFYVGMPLLTAVVAYISYRAAITAPTAD